MAKNIRSFRLFGVNIEVQVDESDDHNQESTDLFIVNTSSVDASLKLDTTTSVNSDPTAYSPMPLGWFHPEIIPTPDLWLGDNLVKSSAHDDDVDTTLSLSNSSSRKSSDSHQKKGKRKLAQVVGSEKKRTSKKRSRANEEEALRPIEENPAELLQAVERLNGSNPIFLYGKKLEESDIRKDQNRLFVNIRDDIMKFLSLENLEQGMEVEAIDVQGNKYKLGLKEWGSLRQMVLKKEWNKLIVKNNAEKGHWIQVWGFKWKDEKSCFAINFVKPHNFGSTSNSCTNSNNGEGTSKINI